MVAAASAADLVVQDDLAAASGKVAEPAEVVMRHARPAVQHDQGQGPWSGAFRYVALVPSAAVAAAQATFDDVDMHEEPPSWNERARQ